MDKDKEIWEEIDKWLWVTFYDKCIKCGKHFSTNDEYFKYRISNTYCLDCNDKCLKHKSYLIRKKLLHESEGKDG